MRELQFLAPTTDYTRPPQGWSRRHDQLYSEFVIAANGKPLLSKLTREEWKHAIMDMVVAIGRDSDHLDRVLTRVLERSASVEKDLVELAVEMGPSPMSDTLRNMAARLSPCPDAPQTCGTRNS